jgi:hypothetical protein
MTDNAADDLARKNLDGLYARVRGQIETEIQLYNQRIVWLITMQAFLFATVGLLVQSVVQAGAAPWLNQIDGLLIIVCVIGALVALISDRLLMNARAACTLMSKFWISRVSEFSVDLLQYYPHVEGGDGRNRRGTFLRSGLLPKYFVAAWVAVALVWFWPKLPTLATNALRLVQRTMNHP